MEDRILVGYTSELPSEIFKENGTVFFKYEHHPMGTEEKSFLVGCSFENVPEEYREKLEFYTIKMQLWLQSFMMDIFKELSE